LDGDPGGYLPVEIEVVPNRLTLVVPKHRSGSFEAKRPLEKE
jgi:diacylglycerol kinase family enzyme